MNTNNHGYFLHIGFELLLFAIFMYYFLRIIYQHVLPFLRDQILAWQCTLQDLKNKKIELAKSREELEKNLKVQYKKLAVLEEKIKRWHQSLLNQQEAKAQEFYAIMKNVEQKRKIQSKNAFVILLQQEVLQQATKSAYQELRTRYQGNEGKKELAKMIEELQ